MKDIKSIEIYDDKDILVASYDDVFRYSVERESLAVNIELSHNNTSNLYQRVIHFLKSGWHIVVEYGED